MVGLDEEGHRRDNLLRSFPVEEVEGPAGAAFRAEAVHKDLVRSPSAAAECWCIRRPDVEVMAMIQAAVVVHPALAAAARQASACRLASAVACPSCVQEEEARGEAVPGPEVDRQATVPVEEASAAHQRFEIRVKWHRAVDRDAEVVVVVLPSTVPEEVARSRREEEDLEEGPYEAAAARSPFPAVLVVLDADGAFAAVDEGEAVVVQELPSADLAVVAVAVAAGPS